MKKCVVATRVGSLTENVCDGETGLLFNYKDAIDLRDKISYLFNNPYKAKEFGKNAVHLINTKYSITKHIDSLIHVFKEVVNAESNNK
jgi:glycosyltransferase involved in cell wall biosynthesis